MENINLAYSKRTLLITKIKLSTVKVTITHNTQTIQKIAVVVYITFGKLKASIMSAGGLICKEHKKFLLVLIYFTTLYQISQKLASNNGVHKR